MIVTMKEVDEARKLASEARDALVAAAHGRHIDQHLTLSVRDRQALYEEATDKVGRLLGQYRAQRSETNLLRLLAHVTQPCPGWVDVADGSINCPDCEDVEALVKEAPKAKGAVSAAPSFDPEPVVAS